MEIPQRRDFHLLWHSTLLIVLKDTWQHCAHSTEASTRRWPQLGGSKRLLIAATGKVPLKDDVKMASRAVYQVYILMLPGLQQLFFPASPQWILSYSFCFAEKHEAFHASNAKLIFLESQLIFGHQN